MSRIVSDMFFRGYVHIDKNKRAQMKFKNTPTEALLTYDQAVYHPNFAGILADDIILIDVDDFEQSEILFKVVKQNNLNCRVYKTTRGKHFLFRNTDVPANRTHCTIALGLQADIKLGKKNSYSVLKFNGVQREILRDIQGDEADMLPRYLIPIGSSADFLNMEQGDGRNQALFNYILTLQSEGFTVEESRECIRIINKCVLADPLPENELDIVLRDDAFKKPVFFNKRTFLHDKFAEHIKRVHRVTKINGNLHQFVDGVYTHDLKALQRLMIMEIPKLTDAQRREALKQLDLLCDEMAQPDRHFIAFNNGLLNINTGDLLPFSSNVIVTNRIPWDYNPHAYDKLMDTTLDKICCNDPEIRMLIEEMLGACFYSSSTVGGGKSFFLTGAKGNGKSTLLDIIKIVLGKNNYSSLDLKEIDERFKTVMLFGKLANIGDDIDSGYKSSTSIFKKIVTGNTIVAEYKGENSFEFDPYATLIFSVNEPPRINDPTGAVQRRLQIIPLKAQFSETDADYDPEIKFKLERQAAIEYVAALGVDGLKRVLKNKRYSQSKKVKAELEEYEFENNPVLIFIEEHGLNNIVNEPTDTVYGYFEGFCIKSGFKGVLNKVNFSKQLKLHFGITTKNTKIKGKDVRVYVQLATR